MAMNHCCLLRKQQKFAVAGISEFLQTPSANSGSEPGNFIGSNYRQLTLYRLLEALAESLTRDFRFLVEKCGRSDRKKTRLQVASATCGLIQVVATMPRCEQARLGSQRKSRSLQRSAFSFTFLMATNHLLFAPQTAKVCGSTDFIFPQTPSANSGSEPSNFSSLFIYTFPYPPPTPLTASQLSRCGSITLAFCHHTVVSFIALASLRYPRRPPRGDL